MAAELWDKRIDTAKFARTWQHWTAKFAAKLAMERLAWTSVAGVFGAAILTVKRIGAEWKQPFVIRCYFGDVDLHTVPPKQVVALARACHACLAPPRVMHRGAATVNRGRILVRY